MAIYRVIITQTYYLDVEADNPGVAEEEVETANDIVSSEWRSYGITYEAFRKERV